jgi:hypothetical protein
MLRNKVVIFFVGVLFAIVVIYNIHFFLKKKSPVQSQKKAVSAVHPGDQKKSGESRLTSVFPVLRDREKWKRDPFQYTGQYTGEKGDRGKPDIWEKRKVIGIKLQGITVRDGKHFALVNGEVVEAGDRIEDVLITGITSYSIFVKDAGGIREINIYNDILEKEK